MSYLYDSLLWSDSTGKLLPWLASRYQRSSDGMTYSFELRDNARWHDGRPVTPDDVVFTFEYFAAQRLFPFVIARPQDVAGVRATGGRAVEIRLEKPVVTFGEGQAAFVPIIPKHVWSSIPDAPKAQDLSILVGSGPYRLDSYSQGQGSHLYTANDDFFLGKPFVKRIEVHTVGDELTALLAGVTDAGQPRATGASTAVLAPFRDDPSFGVLEGPTDLAVALTGTGTRAPLWPIPGSAEPAPEPSTGATSSGA